MSERTNITNFLLLSVLATILLVSGSLQCAFDCLVRVETLQPSTSFHVLNGRIDTCHPAIEDSSPSASCLNKACHQRLPHNRNLGGPEIYQLEKLAQPLYSSSRQPTPQYRAGSAIALQQIDLQPETRLRATTSNQPRQTLTTIRTTVLLC